MSGDPRHASGRAWELAASDLLAKRGIDIIARSYRCRLGELDIVGIDGATLVVIEDRARASHARGSAVETVGARKQRRIINATRHFLMRNPVWFARPIRFDVIAVDGIDTAQPRMQWIKGAFQAS
jgi:putative endonuclease